MTAVLDRPITTRSNAYQGATITQFGEAAPARRATRSQRASAPATQHVTITLTVNLPAEAHANEAAVLADTLRTQAQRVVAARGGYTHVSVTSSPSHPFTEAPGQGSLNPILPRRGGLQPVPLRPRRQGVVSPNAPARRDAEAARLRLLQATAISPASPSGEGITPGLAGKALVIDLFGRRVRIDGEDIDFTHREFELLAFLAANARTIVSREQLMESVWSSASGETGERTVDVHIRRVRNKLGRYRRLISTVRGSGYRLDLGSDVAILR